MGTNGRRYLTPMLNSHKPVDVVVLGLGTNDLKTRFGLSPQEVAQGCALLIQDIKRSECGPSCGCPEIVLVSPPAVRFVQQAHEDFGPRRAERSRETIAQYEALAAQESLAGFVNLEAVSVSEDGLHFDEAGAQAIAHLVAEKVSAALDLRPSKRQRT